MSRVAPRALGTVVTLACSGTGGPDAASTPGGDASRAATGPADGGGPGGGSDAAADARGPDGATSPGDGGAHADAAAPSPRGATLPYIELEAESAATNGTRLGPSRSVDDPDVFRAIAGESSGRQAVRLDAPGQSVRFTTTATANAIVVRYVLPDSPDGAGLQATLGLYVDGARVASLALTSRYAWAYGNPQATDATTNIPGDGFARHFYDEARALLPSDVAPGSTVALQVDATDTAPYYVVDLVDLEEVPPAGAQPAGTVSVASYGARGDGVTDDGQALQSAIADAQARGVNVWLPPGRYLDASTVLDVRNVAVRGAGMWRSTIAGRSARFVCGGAACRLSDLALLGDTTLRDDSASVAGVSGDFGAGSRLDRVWIEHFTTGAWIGTNGNAPTTGLVVSGARVRDTFADGVNLCNGTSQSTVEQSSARNTGDDAFASWAFAGAGNPPNTGNVFRFDTVQVPWRASCFAIYGGTGNAVTDDVCADVVTYPGIFVDQEFDAHPFAGTTSVARDTVVRSGGLMFGQAWGALSVSGHDPAPPVTGVTIADVDLVDPTYAGLLFVGPRDALDGVSLSGVTVTGAGTYGIEVAASASGSATAANVVVSGAASGGLRNGAPSAWTFTRQGGDTGW